MNFNQHFIARLLAGSALLLPFYVGAELTFDDGTGDTLAGDMTIDAARGMTQGANLLHSFFEFNVNAGESATFTGPAAIDNIIARVTGSNATLIDGTLTSAITSADLFLLNPNGVMVSAGASITVDGGLYLTTANSITFEDGSQLMVSESGASGFTAAAPASFGFGLTPSDVSFNGAIIETPRLFGAVVGASPLAFLTVIGGDISIVDSTIFLSEKDINLISLAGEAIVPLDPDVLALRGNVPLGDMTISNAFQPFDANIETSGDVPGKISLAAGSLSLDKGAVFSDSMGEGNGRGIDVAVAGPLVLGDGARITTDALDIGDGGTIRVTAGSVSLTGFDTIIGTENNSFEGNAGTIELTADSVLIESGALISARTSGAGNAGTINISAGSLTLLDGGIIGSTVGQGRGGTVNVTAVSDIQLSGPDATITTESSGFFFGSGEAGTISLHAASLGLSDAASIRSSSGAANAGASGTVTITLGGALAVLSGAEISTDNGSDIADSGAIDITAGSVTVSGVDAFAPDFLFSRITSTTAGASVGGSVNITAQGMTVSNGAVIEARADASGNAGAISIGADLTVDGAKIEAVTSDLGEGGAITLMGPVLVTGGGEISSSTSPPNVDPATFDAADSVPGGNAGTIAFSGASLTVTGVGSAVSSSTFSDGNAGAVSVDSAAVSVLAGGSIATNTSTSGAAGSITATGNSIQVDGNGSVISSATNSIGNAGTVTLAGDVDVVGGGVVSTSTSGAGSGGTISITGNSLSVSGAGSAIASATTAGGAAGSVLMDVGSVTVASGGRVDTSTSATGASGGINISATNMVTVSGADARVTSSTSASATGGTIDIRAADILIDQLGRVTVTAGGSGDAGNVTLVASHRLDILNQGNVETNALVSGGGSINIDVVDRIYLRDSTITASSGGPEAGADGGNIRIDPIFFILDNSFIVAQAVQGNGGIIDLFADNFIRDAGSTISATSELGNDGEVTITSPDNSVTGVVGVLPTGFAENEALLSEPCAARALEERSSLVVVGAGGVEGAPDDFRTVSALSCVGPSSD